MQIGGGHEDKSCETEQPEGPALEGGPSHDNQQRLVLVVASWK